MITLLIATRNAHKADEIRAILGKEFRCLTLNDFPEAPEVIEDAATFAGNAIKKALELARWVQKVQSPKSKVQSPESEVQGPKSKVQSPESEVHGPQSTGHGPQSTGEAFFVLADDSGLEVDALNGAPGVHSARFAALDTGQPGNSPTPENNAKLLRLLKDVPSEQRAARFRCVLALTSVHSPQSTVHSPQSTVHGPQSTVHGPQSTAYSPQVQSPETKLFEGACEGRIGCELRGKGGFGYDPLFFPSGYEQTFGELGEEVKNRLSHRAKALEKLKAYFALPVP